LPGRIRSWSRGCGGCCCGAITKLLRFSQNDSSATLSLGFNLKKVKSKHLLSFRRSLLLHLSQYSCDLDILSCFLVEAREANIDSGEKA
jgi:hypothetical protein